MMPFRRLFDTSSTSFAYIFGCITFRDAIIIDPLFEQHTRRAALLKELSLKVNTVNTRARADHVTDSWLMKDSEAAKITRSDNYRAEGQFNWCQLVISELVSAQ